VLYGFECCLQRAMTKPTKETTMKKTLLFLLAAAALLSACNTVNGMGEDIKGAGEWTSDSAQKVKHKIDQ